MGEGGGRAQIYFTDLIGIFYSAVKGTATLKASTSEMKALLKPCDLLQIRSELYIK